jgi:UTP--glucose-1-phosphate uridylyltransferase
MATSIRKAIVLAAGYGTRFLPQTKAMPKEMLPIVDKPVIQYVVEDAVAAGIEDIIIVTSAQKRSIEDHFDHSFELESMLEQCGKTDILQQVKDIAELANFIYIRQKGPKGTLPAIQCGYEAVGEEPCLVMWGDDFYTATPTRAEQMVAAYEKYNAPILPAYETSDPEAGARYGFVTGDEVEPGILKVKEIVEKPGKGQAPSTYATVGGLLITPEYMDYASQTPAAANGEYNYNATLELMLKDGHAIYAAKIKDGTYYDCGNKFEYIKTTIELALQNPEMGPQLREYLETL